MNIRSTISGQLTKRLNVEALKQYMNAGWTVIPLRVWNEQRQHPRTGKLDPVGKAPLDPDWPRRTYEPRAVVKRCVAEGRNVGARPGKGWRVLDYDPRHDEDGEQLERFRERFANFDLRKYPRVDTGGGGWHIYGRFPADVLTGEKVEGLSAFELKGPNRQLVAAGSIHPNGKLYKWAEGHPPLKNAPEFPPEMVKAYRRSKSHAETKGGQYTPKQLANALGALDPANFRDHDEWLRLMMACHHATAGDGRTEFVEWSIRDPLYCEDAEIIEGRWDSLHAEKTDGLTYRTLNKILADHGAANVQVAAEIEDDEFDSVTEEPSEDAWMDDGEQPGTSLTSSEVGLIETRGLKINNRTQTAPDTFTNALAAIHKIGLNPAWNELGQHVVLRANPLPWPEHYGRVLNDHVLRLVRACLAQKFQGVGYEPGKDNVLEAVATLGYQNKFNPILEYLDSLQWDGRERAATLFTVYFNCGDGAYARAVSLCFLIGAVRRQRHPGCKLDTMPVLLGPQGVGKSEGMKRLFGDDYFTDSDLGSLRDKDASMKLRGKWVKEFAEIESLTRSETGQMKAFLSSATDRQRDPYSRIAEDQPRRTVFVGTVNESGYLRDPTGGRRFWPLEVQAPIELDRIARDRDQIWAEAAAMEARGDSHVLPSDLWAEAGKRQRDQTSGDPWADLLRDFLRSRAEEWKRYDEKLFDVAESDDDVPPLPPDRVHTSELFSALGIAPDQQNSQKSQRIRTVMEVTLGWQHKSSIRISGRNGAGFVDRNC